MSDELPTRPLPQHGETVPHTEERGKNRTLIIILSILAGLLLIAFTVVLTLLLSGQSAGNDPVVEPSASLSTEPSPSASLEPSAEPDAEPTAEPTDEPEETTAPPAPPPPAIIASYSSSPKSVDCSGGGPVPVTFSWSTSGAKVSFGVATEFADSQPYLTDLPATHSESVNYQCGQSGNKQIYSIAVFDSGSNVIARKTLTVTETG